MSISLMSSSLLLQQCPACLVCLIWRVFVLGGGHMFSKGIHPKVKVITRLEFQLADFDTTAQQFSHNASKSSHMPLQFYVYILYAITKYFKVYTHTHTHTHTHIYIYINKHMFSLSLSLSLSIYLSVCLFVSLSLSIYIYIYIYI